MLGGSEGVHRGCKRRGVRMGQRVAEGCRGMQEGVQRGAEGCREVQRGAEGRRGMQRDAEG